MLKRTMQAIRDHGVATYPQECCGLVVKAGRREWYVPCRNTAASEEHFVMSAQDYAAAEESGRITAVVHSHPDATALPSEMCIRDSYITSGRTGTGAYQPLIFEVIGYDCGRINTAATWVLGAETCIRDRRSTTRVASRQNPPYTTRSESRPYR